ncbi:MAG: hypothetical protein F2599_05310 [Actinobacteria bacterium]|uniref:Unannotated protein n=1 Tax=freshwater metagenome TaxID=449393 RepID=A0A6J6ISK6_9ZZZZ|nr:hypothetical protein [Actinomycetota bacterium]
MIRKISKGAAAATLGLALVLTGVNGAYAVDTPSTSETPAPVAKVAKKDKAAIDAYKLAKADYQVAITAFKAAKQEFEAQKAAHKLAMDELNPALTAYASAKKVIGQTFSSAMQAAKATFDLAVAGEVTAEQKLAAKSAFEQARTTATAARTAALSALGTAPVKPAAPVKPTKPVKPSRP